MAQLIGDFALVPSVASPKMEVVKPLKNRSSVMSSRTGSSSWSFKEIKDKLMSAGTFKQKLMSKGASLCSTLPNKQTSTLKEKLMSVATYGPNGLKYLTIVDKTCGGKRRVPVLKSPSQNPLYARRRNSKLGKENREDELSDASTAASDPNSDEDLPPLPPVPNEVPLPYPLATSRMEQIYTDDTYELIEHL